MFSMIAALLVFLFPLAFSPGPGNVVFAINGARQGFRATLPATLGYHLATWAVTLIIGLGLMTAFDSLPLLFRAVQITGALYVLWIAWEMLNAAHSGQDHLPRPFGFRDGVLLLLSNPKAYVIISLMFTQFLDPTASSQIFAVVLITTIFTANNLIAFSVWTLAGEQLAQQFSTPNMARAMNTGFAALLALVAVWLLIR